MERDRQLQGIVPDARITMPPVSGARHSDEREEEEGERRVQTRIGAPGGAGLAGQASAVLHEMKIISCNGSRYKPSWKERAVDKRVEKLPEEYRSKARKVDRKQGTVEGVIGRVEARLIGMGELRGLVGGNFGELSNDFHDLIKIMATSRVRVVGPGRGKRGMMRSEEAERAIAITGLRRRFGVMAVRCQASSLLGRLETLGPGGAAAVGRRWQAGEVQRRWRKEEQSHALASRQGFRALRSGFAMLD